MIDKNGVSEWTSSFKKANTLHVTNNCVNTPFFHVLTLQACCRE